MRGGTVYTQDASKIGKQPRPDPPWAAWAARIARTQAAPPHSPIF